MKVGSYIISDKNECSVLPMYFESAKLRGIPLLCTYSLVTVVMWWYVSLSRNQVKMVERFKSWKQDVICYLMLSWRDETWSLLGELGPAQTWSCNVVLMLWLVKHLCTTLAVRSTAYCQRNRWYRRRREYKLTSHSSWLTQEMQKLMNYHDSWFERSL